MNLARYIRGGDFTLARLKPGVPLFLANETLDSIPLRGWIPNDW